jgi:hypothetical protein
MTSARDLSDRLADLLRREHGALAEFLLALADFDRRRLWAELGHASLFSFLHRDLGLSRGASHYRTVAAGLVQRFPAIVEPIRDGRLCFSSVVELAKVLTPENEAEVLPRFFHRSKAEAKAVTAELLPQPVPRRTVVTELPAPARAAGSSEGAHVPGGARGQVGIEAVHLDEPRPPAPSATAENVRAAPPAQAPRAVAVPLTADLRRLHLTVSKRLLDKLDAARDALAHAMPGASVEEILEKGLDLVLDQAAKRRGLTSKPAKPRPCKEDHVPARVRAAVWRRDQGRCQWPIQSGGICGSTHRVELDHISPQAQGGPSTEVNLRCLCDRHNQEAARRVFGEEWMLQFCRPAP